MGNNEILPISPQSLIWAVSKKMAPTCEKNVQIKLTPNNFLLIIFNVVYIEVNETRKKL